MNIMIMPKIAKHSNECEREENSEASNVYCINDKNCEDELINGIGESKGEEQKCEESSACQDNLSYRAKNDEELRINSVVEKNNEEEKRESSYTCQESTETGAKVYINGVAEANNEEKKCEEKCEKSIKVGLNANQVQSNSEANMTVLHNDVRNSAAIINGNGDNKQLTLAVNLRDDENAASEEYTSLNTHGQPNQLSAYELIKDSRQQNKSAGAQNFSYFNPQQNLNECPKENQTAIQFNTMTIDISEYLISRSNDEPIIGQNEQANKIKCDFERNKQVSAIIYNCETSEYNTVSDGNDYSVIEADYLVIAKDYSVIKEDYATTSYQEIEMRSSDYITPTQEEYYSEFTSGNRLHDIIRLPSMINTEVIIIIHNIATFKRC